MLTLIESGQIHESSNFDLAQKKYCLAKIWMNVSFILTAVLNVVVLLIDAMGLVKYSVFTLIVFAFTVFLYIQRARTMEEHVFKAKVKVIEAEKNMVIGQNIQAGNWQEIKKYQKNQERFNETQMKDFKIEDNIGKKTLKISYTIDSTCNLEVHSLWGMEKNNIFLIERKITLFAFKDKKFALE